MRVARWALVGIVLTMLTGCIRAPAPSGGPPGDSVAPQTSEGANASPPDSHAAPRSFGDGLSALLVQDGNWSGRATLAEGECAKVGLVVNSTWRATTTFRVEIQMGAEAARHVALDAPNGTFEIRPQGSIRLPVSVCASASGPWSGTFAVKLRSDAPAQGSEFGIDVQARA